MNHTPPDPQDTALRPCPFCGAERIDLFELDIGSWAGHCPACKAIGPIGADPADAVARWNQATRCDAPV